MKLKNMVINYSKIDAYLESEGKNQSRYYDEMVFKVISKKITLLVDSLDELPKELLEKEIYDFGVEIVLCDKTRKTYYGNRYRAKKTTITLWID